VGASDPDDDRHDLIKGIAFGFSRDRVVELVDTSSYENDGYVLHQVSLSLDRKGADLRTAYDEAKALCGAGERSPRHRTRRPQPAMRDASAAATAGRTAKCRFGPCPGSGAS
jgi:hypothetical protein